MEVGGHVDVSGTQRRNERVDVLWNGCEMMIVDLFVVVTSVYAHQELTLLLLMVKGMSFSLEDVLILCVRRHCRCLRRCRLDQIPVVGEIDCNFRLCGVIGAFSAFCWSEVMSTVILGAASFMIRLMQPW